MRRSETVCIDQPGEARPLEIAFRDTGGERPPVVYLHGLGSDADDFTLLENAEARRRYRLLAPDLPGHGDSPEPDGVRLTIDAVAEGVVRFATVLDLGPFDLIGHSLGGVIALRIAEAHTTLVRSLANIEGNLVSEDCGILSREGARPEHRSDPERYFARLTASLRRCPLAGYARFAADYRTKLSGRRSWFDYCVSLVEHSDSGELLAAFLRLTIPRTFVYGRQNRPGFLAELTDAGVRVAAIDDSSHWPMYSASERLETTLLEHLTAARFRSPRRERPVRSFARKETP